MLVCSPRAVHPPLIMLVFPPCEHKTWSEAQRYCRQNYVDLASIDDMAEMNRLNNTVKAGSLTEPAWIGLYNTSWRWSLGDTELNTTEFWDKKNGQPDNAKRNEFCVWMKKGLWHDEKCDKQHHFVCYGEFPCPSAYSLVCKTFTEICGVDRPV
uniref:C-type lectin domain-containing protein n=1 Tax=Hucho hucho TaxID=62062 RepID=A0A4W5KQ68_9TELE